MKRNDARAHLAARVAGLRRSKRALSRLTTCSLDLQHAHTEAVVLWPLIAGWRVHVRRRVQRRLPPPEGNFHLLAAYALPGEAQLRPWPGRLEAVDGGVVFVTPEHDEPMDLSDADLVTHCDGMAWIDVARHGTPIITLAVYAEESAIRRLLPISCGEQD